MRPTPLFLAALLVAVPSHTAPAKPDMVKLQRQLAAKDVIIANLRRQIATTESQLATTNAQILHHQMLIFPARGPNPLPEVILGIPSNLDDQNPGRSIIVSFNVGADGKPKDAKLEQFSGNDTVDQMALKAALNLFLPPSPSEPTQRHLRYLFKVQRQ